MSVWHAQDKVVAFNKVATMYIRYTLVFRKLEECYDQMVHPQKRRLIRHMLDGTIGRCNSFYYVVEWVHSPSEPLMHIDDILLFACRFVSLRILEMKQELFSLELLEYSYFDDLLTDMKLTPVSRSVHTYGL